MSGRSLRHHLQAHNDPRNNFNEDRTPATALPDAINHQSAAEDRAGGESAGKPAKLGKLIVEDEGLRMLDLVVAANMSIWWIAWESADTES